MPRKITETNPFTAYYETQAGSGLSGFQGQRYQKGNGFFGRLFKGSVLPLLRYLGRQALNTGMGVAEDVAHGDNFGASLRKHLRTVKQTVAKDTLEKLKDIKQSGSGLKRKHDQNFFDEIIKEPPKKKHKTTKTRKSKAKVTKRKGIKRKRKGRQTQIVSKKKAKSTKKRKRKSKKSVKSQKLDLDF